MSELKVLSYLGNHVNIVNLLGACTVGGEKSSSKGNLTVRGFCLNLIWILFSLNETSYICTSVLLSICVIVIYLLKTK